MALTIDAGAATWGSGTTGVKGLVGAANSLVGSTADDTVTVGDYGVTALTNGNYVVGSPYWNNGAATDCRGGDVGQRHDGRQGRRQRRQQPRRQHAWMTRSATTASRR